MLKPVFDNYGRQVGWEDENGTYYDAASGRIESRTGADGTAYDPEGNRLGWGDEHGTVMDPSGNIAGWSPDGMVVGSSGKPQGWVGSHSDNPPGGAGDRRRDTGAIIRLSDYRPVQPSQEPAPQDIHRASSPGIAGPPPPSSAEHSPYDLGTDEDETDEIFLVLDDDLP